MLTASRALRLSSKSAPELPRVPGLRGLYAMGVRPRQGEVIMVAGRSGMQKSGFVLWWVSQMRIPTLYFSADMSPFQASVRLACAATQETTEQVEWGMRDPETAQRYFAATDPKIMPVTFSFGHITWWGVQQELDAYVELHNTWPQVIVIDNLMDVEDAQADYTAQMDAMQNISDLSRATGATIFVLHHATDKGWKAQSDPWRPPSRDEIKGGMAEKPELALTVALEAQSHFFRVACVKQRMGPSDPLASNFAVLRADPARTTFMEYDAAPRGSKEEAA